VEADLGRQNIGLASAWMKAAIRDDWRRILIIIIIIIISLLKTHVTL